MTEQTSGNDTEMWDWPDTRHTPCTSDTIITPSSRHGCISLAIRPPEALLCFCTVQPVLFVTALNVSKNWKWDFKRASELKIHPFRVVTIVQWWQQSSLCLSSGSWLWQCLGIFPGACDYCDYSDCSVVTLAPHRIVFYIKFREIMSSRMSASRGLRSLQSQLMAAAGWASGWAYWEIRCVTQYKECYQSQYSPLLSSQYHNPGKIYHGSTMETSSQYQHQPPLPIHNLHRWQLLYSVPCLPPTILNGRHYNSSFFQLTYFI